MAAHEQFSVLFVCTANRFRSPLAEHFLRHHAQRHRLDWEILSAGTRARAGDALDSSVADVLQRRGVSVGQWASRPLTPDLLDRADLVLAAAREHRAEIVAMAPRAVRKTFLLAQFAQILTAAPVTEHLNGADLTRWVMAARGGLQPVAPGADDIPDPYKRSKRVLRACADQIEAATRSIVVATGRGATH